MLQLTYQDGRVVQRVFAAHVSTQEDADSLIKELQGEVVDNDTGKPLLVEIWRDVTPKPCTCKKERKKPSVNGHSGVHLVR